MFDALKGTPWWVFALFVYLLIVGIRAMKPVSLSLKRMNLFILLVLVFAGWTIYSFISRHGVEIGKILMGISSFLVGSIVGWLIGRKAKISIDHTEKKIRLPGSILPLILILLMFGLKYFFAYTYATDPAAKESALVTAFDILSTTLIAGIFFGRFLSLFTRYFKGFKDFYRP